jgi:hypothetical protein
MNAEHAPLEGQIWKDNDKRQTRDVYVHDVGGGWVQIQTCEEEGEFLSRRKSHVAADRFTGAFSLVRG